MSTVGGIDLLNTTSGDNYVICGASVSTLPTNTTGITKNTSLSWDNRAFSNPNLYGFSYVGTATSNEITVYDCNMCAIAYHFGKRTITKKYANTTAGGLTTASIDDAVIGRKYLICGIVDSMGSISNIVMSGINKEENNSLLVKMYNYAYGFAVYGSATDTTISYGPRAVAAIYEIG